jgi:imidazolonepropionase-like amidohydrolase
MRTVLTGGAVFDGTGSDVASADVVIEDGRIVDVGPGLDGDGAVDVGGKTLLPGMFDCHVHIGFRHEDFDLTRTLHEPFTYRFFRFAEILRWYLDLGITSVRDASGVDAGVRKAVADGILPGPRVQISVNMLSITGGHSDEWLPSGARWAYGRHTRGCRTACATGSTAWRRRPAR